MKEPAKIPIAYPSPLRPGMRIAVTAPSSGVEPRLHARLDLAIEHLRSLGFHVEEGACLRHERRSASAPVGERVAELMRFLLRDDIDAIIPPWGGELAIELLDHLDWPALQAARPKWVLGYSDTSTWMLPLSLRLKWATAHGPCLMELVPNQQDPLTAGMLRALAVPTGDCFEQSQSARWQLHWIDYAHAPEASYNLTEPTRWKCMNRDDDASIEFSGRLLGGCLDTLLHIAGTPYGDIPRFVADTSSDRVVLYLENCGLTPTKMVRALHRLRWSGWFDHAAGVLIGRSAASDTANATELRYEEALQSQLGSLACPVLIDVDVGHRPPQMVLINGAMATARFDGRQGGRIVQHLI